MEALYTCTSVAGKVQVRADTEDSIAFIMEKARKEHEREIIDVVDEERRPSMKIVSPIFFLSVQNGQLAQCPIYESSRWWKNWAATVYNDPRSSKPLRRFWRAIPGEFYYWVPGGLSEGHLIAFGADYCGHGHCNCRQLFATVLGTTSTMIELMQIPVLTAKQATAAAVHS